MRPCFKTTNLAAFLAAMMLIGGWSYDSDATPITRRFDFSATSFFPPSPVDPVFGFATVTFDPMGALPVLDQTVGIAASPEQLYRLADGLGQAGVTRISALGRMTAPEAGWHHDGRFNLLDLITLTEIEHSAETAADDFAAYVD